MSAIAGVEDGRGSAEILAADAPSLAIAIPEPPSGAVELSVVGLARSLADLGLMPGPVPDPTGLSRPLRDLDRTAAVVALYRDGGWTEWMDRAELPGVFAEVRLPLLGCLTTIDVMVERLATGDRIALAAAIDDERALIVAKDRAYVFRPGTGVERSAVLPNEMIGGFLESPERAHLGTGSSIYTLDVPTLSATLTASVVVPIGFGTIQWMDGIDAGGFRLTAFATGGDVLRLEGGRLEVVAGIDPIDSGIDSGLVFEVTPEETLIGADNHSNLYRFDGMSITAELTGGVDAKGFAAIAEVAGLGIVTVELGSGEVFVRSSGQWSTIGTTVTEARVVHPIAERRFLVSDSFGRWEEFHPVHGFGCGRIETRRLGEVRAIFQLGDAIYGVGIGDTSLTEIIELARVE
jgi:hypothetical protein